MEKRENVFLPMKSCIYNIFRLSKLSSGRMFTRNCSWQNFKEISIYFLQISSVLSFERCKKSNEEIHFLNLFNNDFSVIILNHLIFWKDSFSLDFLYSFRISFIAKTIHFMNIIVKKFLNSLKMQMQITNLTFFQKENGYSIYIKGHTFLFFIFIIGLFSLGFFQKYST